MVKTYALMSYPTWNELCRNRSQASLFGAWLRSRTLQFLTNTNIIDKICGMAKDLGRRVKGTEVILVSKYLFNGGNGYV